MAIEIERKFLVNHQAWKNFNKPNGVTYRQGYISTDPKTTVRVRIAGDKSFLTIKGINKGASRAEFEYAIPLADANEMLDTLTGNEISKTRYKVNYNGKTWEVDEFKGENEGLIVAEIELKDENESFDLPDWVNDEVTMDERYYNSSLSINPYKNW